MKDQLETFVSRTGGLSGAEIVAVCQLAGELAFRADQTREISVKDLDEAIKRTPKSITTKMLHEYETWNAERTAG